MFKVGDWVELNADNEYNTTFPAQALKDLVWPKKVTDNSMRGYVTLEGVKTEFVSERFKSYKQPVATKATNPKDAVGTSKVPMSTVPGPVMMEVGLAMLEGARKYGRHNYRAYGARGSVYYDAAMRHILAWWEGQDIDPDSGLSHISKCIATLVVMRDTMINGKLVDDRPPASKDGWIDELNKAAAKIIEKYPDAQEAHVQCECDEFEDYKVGGSCSE